MKRTRQPPHPPATSKKASCHVNMGCHDDDGVDGSLTEPPSKSTLGRKSFPPATRIVRRLSTFESESRVLNELQYPPRRSEIGSKNGVPGRRNVGQGNIHFITEGLIPQCPEKTIVPLPTAQFLSDAIFDAYICPF